LKGMAAFDKSGLLFDSMIRINWIMTVKRILVDRNIGEEDEDLRAWVNQVVPKWLAI
jgi:hypothetical protein